MASCDVAAPNQLLLIQDCIQYLLDLEYSTVPWFLGPTQQRKRAITLGRRHRRDQASRWVERKDEHVQLLCGQGIQLSYEQ